MFFLKFLFVISSFSTLSTGCADVSPANTDPRFSPIHSSQLSSSAIKSSSKEQPMRIGTQQNQSAVVKGFLDSLTDSSHQMFSVSLGPEKPERVSQGSASPMAGSR
jgi:hypothetical protein